MRLKHRNTIVRVTVLAAAGTIVCVVLSYVGYPRVAISMPPPLAQLGKGGELAISVHKGYLYVQKHSFLGIGIPPYRANRYPSVGTWEWYHRPIREPEGVWAPHLGKDRQHGVMAYWYHTEFWIRRIPLWLAGIPLALLACGGILLVGGFRSLFRWMRFIHRVSAGRCGKCGYDLTGNVSGVCPECGCATESAA